MSSEKVKTNWYEESPFTIDMRPSQGVGDPYIVIRIFERKSGTQVGMRKISVYDRGVQHLNHKFIVQQLLTPLPYDDNCLYHELGVAQNTLNNLRPKPKDINQWFFKTFGMTGVRKQYMKLRNKLILAENADIKMHFAHRGGQTFCLRTIRRIDERAEEIRQMIDDGNRKIVWLALVLWENGLRRKEGTFRVLSFDTNGLKERVRKSNEKGERCLWKYVCNTSEFKLKKMFLSTYADGAVDLRLLPFVPASCKIEVFKQLMRISAPMYCVNDSHGFRKNKINILSGIMHAEGVVKSASEEWLSEIHRELNDTITMLRDIREKEPDSVKLKKLAKALEHGTKKNMKRIKLKEIHDKAATLQREIKEADFKKPFATFPFLEDYDVTMSCKAVRAKSPEELHKIGSDFNNCVYDRRESCKKDSVIYSLVRNGKATSVLEYKIFIEKYDDGSTQLDYIELDEHKAKNNDSPSDRDITLEEGLRTLVRDSVNKYIEAENAKNAKEKEKESKKDAADDILPW